jgi:hypothetical protein
LLIEGGEQRLLEIWRCGRSFGGFSQRRETRSQQTLLGQTSIAVSTSGSVSDEVATESGFHEAIAGQIEDVIFKFMAIHRSHLTVEL